MWKKIFLLAPLPIFILTWSIFVFDIRLSTYTFIDFSENMRETLLTLMFLTPLFTLIGIIYLIYKKYYLSAICYLIVGGGPFIRLYVVSVLNADFGFNI